MGAARCAGPSAARLCFTSPYPSAPPAQTACSGETITGHLACKPNAKNPRDLDIVIDYEFDGERGRAKGEQSYRMR